MAKPDASSCLTRPACRAGEVFSRVLSRLAGTARFVVNTFGVHNKALQISVLCLVSSAAWAATIAGTTITNSVLASYQVSGTPYNSLASLSVTTDGAVQFLAISPSGTSTAVAATQCASSGSSSGPFDLTSTVTAGNIALAPATMFSNGQGVYVEVTDLTKNLNPVVLDTVAVIVTGSSTPGDSETLQLTETGPNTGVFVGAIKSSLGAVTANDCSLSVVTNSTISAAYQRGPLTSLVAASALVDPYGLVFNSVNGLPVDGATVTLLNSSNGQPVTVLCDDATTLSPNPIVTGSTIAACGTTLTMLPGSYRFPLIAPGNYELQVIPPAGYTFASIVSPAGLPAGYSVLGAPGAGASYGTPFVVNPGTPIHIDIPVDPPSGTLQITKTAEKPVVSAGEFAPYTLTIHNNDTTNPALNVLIADRLPQGFRYQSGSARMGSAALTDPSISADGRTLTFSLGNIAAGSAISFKYVAQVTAGAALGKAENVAASVSHVSNTARASVTVREDLMLSRAILMGRVIIGSCDNRADNDEHGLQNARIVLEDGTAVLTDTEGRWHAGNIRPGTHVVQLDLDSLPAGYKAITCEENTRFAGRNFSQFVNVRGGSLWRADFHVQKAQKEMRLTQNLTAQRDDQHIHIELTVHGEGDVYQASSTFLLPDGAQLIIGSVRLDGMTSNALEINDGVLILRTGEQKGDWTHTLTFDLMAAQEQLPKLAALTRFLPTSASQGINLPRTEIQLTKGNSATETFSLIPQAAQDVDQRTATPDRNDISQPPGADSRNQLVEHLPYDADWLSTAQPGTEWLHPQESFLPAIPAIKAAVKLLPGQRATLKLNGEEISPLYFDGTESNIQHTVMLATWRGIHIKEGDNRMELIVKDESGAEVLRQSRNIHYTVTPDSVEFAPEYSRLVADGKTRTIIAVRFFDQDGYKMRRGINGEFQLNGPYQSFLQTEAIERDPLGGKTGGKPRYEVGADGIALIELAPTTQSGEVVLNFKFDDNRTQEVRTWLAASQRDWVLVGFAEGTSGHKQLSGNMTALQDSAADEQLFDGDRVALYAKGAVKGEYLLTMAYDSAKHEGDAGSSPTNLNQAIDPTRYYTLYADNTQATFDAASTSKLYLKIERKQFYALFGDFNTGLTVTEFSRYSRTVNGIKSEYKGENFGYNAFATQTAQAYIKDEIAGDGTSGLYKLSRSKLMENSEKIRIETRGRFQSQVIVSSQTMTRYLDYDIDYINGTIFFKQPVTARDADFNPIFIVAEYESKDPRDETVTGGGRVSIKAGKQVEIGASLIHDGTEGATGNLGGLDATWKVSSKTNINAEYARSERDLTVPGLKPEGSAWKTEIARHDNNFDAKAYVREQDGAFGLGQQAASESSTRKFGGDARLKISDTVQVQGQAYRQDTLSTVNTQRNVADARVNYNSGDLTSHIGTRYAGDNNGQGATRESQQAMAGVGYSLLDKTLTLRADTEIGVGKSANGDFPNRLRLGTDYKLTEQTRMFVEQEYARSKNFASNMTSAGLRTKPWSGSEMSASLANQNSLDSERTYANLGLVQRWQINKYWQADAGIDRAQTLRNISNQPLNYSVPPASGSRSGDYTAVNFGANYNDSIWGANSRIERRTSSTDQRHNFLIGFQHNLDAGRVLSAGFNYTASQSTISHSRRSSTRLSYAHRPWDSAWIWLDQLDHIDEATTHFVSGTVDHIHTSKLINNFNANWMPQRDTQVALQYGAKYVLDNIDHSSYSGYTDLIGIELRHDLTKKWDAGAHAHQLHTWNAGVTTYGLGASLGYKIVNNAWAAVGYNLLGFNDGDFSGANYRAKGFYITLRMKFDQDTLKLNDNESFLRQP